MTARRRTLSTVSVLLIFCALAPAAPAATTTRPTVSVGSATVGPAVPAGFVGLASEYTDIETEVGTNPADPDTPFEQAVRSLAPYGDLVLRIGGDTTDWTWWPIPHRKPPGWVRFTLTPTWAAVTKKLAEDLNAHLILGINMEADSSVIARTEVDELAAQLGSSVPVTYEIGNEPELYSKFPFFRFPAFSVPGGGPVLGRSKGYSYADITADWNRIEGALPQAVKLAGPGYSSTKALPYISQFLDKARRLSLLTVHSYPLKSTRCGATNLQEQSLFAPTSLKQLADAMKPWTRVAGTKSVGVRVDEMNAVTCGGMPNFSNSLGPALWALNILPLYVEAGVEGVNFQSRPSTAQNLIQPVQTKSGWQVEVQPEYYGLLAFAQLTPPGSQLLKVSAKAPASMLEWAVRTPSGQTSMVLTNVTTKATTVAVRVAGKSGAATMEILRAGSGGLSATTKVSLGGQSLSATTGQLTGSQVTTPVPSSNGPYDVKAPTTGSTATYLVKVPAASAAIVTIPPQ